ncbi:High mobility group [Coemansia sp. RSA 455]|nr:High mobility group [Coemansia sp. RSA 455]
MVTKPASGNAGATFAKLAEAYETLALIHSKASGTPMPPKKVVIKRDPNEPKKPPSAYILFLHDKRLEIKDKQPGDTPSEVMAKTFEAWSTISDEERRRYEELAAAAKKEYVDELAKYKAEHGTPPVESEKEEEEEEDDVPEPVAPVVAPSKVARPKKTKDSDAPVKTVPKLDEPKKKTKDSDIPAKTVADKDEPKKKTELAPSNGAAPEKRKKKSSSAGGPAPTVVAENGGEHHDSEKKKKKKKSHKSKHSESQ